MTRFQVGIEEGPGGAMRVHPLDLLGCTAEGPDRDRAVAAFTHALAEWLAFLASTGEPIPQAGALLEISVDEWIVTDADVAGGASDVCFAADLRPLDEAEIATALRRLGDLRGQILAAIRTAPAAALERRGSGGWSAGAILEELARAQWWALSRLGATPLAAVPPRTLGRLDTALALAVQQLTTLPPERRGLVLELDDERWTPRKVLRRLLWLEWSLGRAARHALASLAAAS